MANPFDQFDAAPPVTSTAPPGSLGGYVVRKPVDPYKGPRDQAGLTGQNMDNRITEATLAAVVRKTNAEADIAEGKRGDTRLDNTMKLRSAFEAQQGVKDYRSSIPQVTAGLKTANTPSGDNALIYAYAKVMDPGSAVRESEAAGVANSDTMFGRAMAYAQKQLDGKGTFSPEARAGLRREMINKTVQLNRAYQAERERYSADAQASDIDPVRVIGKHSGAPYLADIKAYAKAQRAPDPAMSSAIDGLIRSGTPYGAANSFVTNKGGTPIDRATYEAALAHSKANPGYSKSYASATRETPGYDDSTLAQALSGVNEGLASVAGAPVDLVTGAINLGSQGINTLANTDIPMIENPTLGSDWIKDRMDGWATTDPTNDPTKQFVRRVGESVGAAVVPAGFAGSLARGGGQLIAGALGGVGGASAQRAFPGNPLAEMAGEILAGGAGAAGLMKVGQRGAQRAIEAAVPTVDQLKTQAGGLYRQAEARGVVANPTQTQQLADDFRAALEAEGQVTPTGRILTEAYPKANAAVKLVDDYAGRTMTPTQMQPVRKMASDGLSSDDATERRLGRILTDVVDGWANPLAPELREARDVSSRYLTAETLGRSRELAGANAGMFSGSGFENALRTQYRGLDRAEIKNQMQFSDDVTDAIQTVSRGTPGSNFARGIGRLAPRGVVSFGLGTGMPAMLGTMVGGPTMGAVAGGGALALGEIGRAAATGMGLRNANIAELVARNGGKLPEAAFSSPEIMQALHALAAAESAKYLPQSVEEQPGDEAPGYQLPDPLARRKNQKPFASPPGALALPFR